MSKAKVSVVSFSNLTSDPRVYRQLKFLGESFDIKAYGYGAMAVEGGEFFDVKVLGQKVKSLYRGQWRGGLWPVAYEVLDLVRGGLGGLSFVGCALLPRWLAGDTLWGCLASAKPFRRTIQSIVDSDLVILNDFTGLLLLPALRTLGVKRVLYDAHEYTPGQFGTSRKDQRKLRFVNGFLRRNLKLVDGMVTVCDGIADLYAREFGVLRPTVVMNAPFFRKAAEPHPRESNKIRIVHHGVAAKQRHLELMIGAVRLAGPDFELHFFLVNKSPAYYTELEALGSKAGNVFFHAPVPMTELSERLAMFDVGMYLLPPSTLNHEFALPNKLFEFLQARLAIAIGPSPEMRKIVEQFDVGVVSENFTPDAMVAVLRTLSEQRIKQFKENAEFAARSVSGESQGALLLVVVSGLLELKR